MLTKYETEAIERALYQLDRIADALESIASSLSDNGKNKESDEEEFESII